MSSVIRYFHGFQSIDELDFEKVNGLMPAIVQDCQTGMVLMLGYMNKEALQNVRSSTGLVLEESEVCRLVVAVSQTMNYLANQSYVR